MKRVKLIFLKLRKLVSKKYFIVSFALIIILIGRSLLLKEPSNDLIFTVTRGSIVDTVHVNGTYITAAQTEVISPAQGIITELYVKNNDQVKKGNPLFHIESTATNQEKAITYATYQAAITLLKTAKQNKENSDSAMWVKQKALLDAENTFNFMNERLAESGDNPTTGEQYTHLEIESIKSLVVQTRKDFRSLEKAYKEADQSIISAQAKVNSTKFAYDATQSITVKASADGKVVNLLKRVGDEVSASTALKVAPPVLIIADLENPVIIAKVSEAYIPRLSEGQKAEIVFDVAPDEVFMGFIETIDVVGTDLAGIVTYDARVSVQNIVPFMKPNMSSTLIIETFRKDNILFVPNSAIVFSEGKTYVREADKKEDNLIEVELGVKALIQTEIINGLFEGLKILANPSPN